ADLCDKMRDALSRPYDDRADADRPDCKLVLGSKTPGGVTGSASAFPAPAAIYVAKNIGGKAATAAKLHFVKAI
ncbi:hypothetical protein, partial [Serratia marcescens]|uniref:hypothetical protein n=1 Tax=Serratia marcescens TaxID=615 RepID=UPI0019543BBC